MHSRADARLTLAAGPSGGVGKRIFVPSLPSRWYDSPHGLQRDHIAHRPGAMAVSFPERNLWG